MDGSAAAALRAPASSSSAAIDPRAKFIQGDLRQPESIEAALKTAKPEAVIHFAAYIEVGESKGTVEQIRLRSLFLRHHRGAINVLPYGEIRRLRNQSRDWVIDKMTIGITYDSDLEKARKLIKKIGAELAADPELAPKTIEPLKMQGVEQFGDFAIQIRMKMKTLPGEQFVIRRKAFAMIKKAFDANGIKFAFPTVQVAGGGEVSASVANAAGT